MAKKYCDIFSKLVQGDGDMVGHIAYSLYKLEKVQYISEYKKENNIDVVPDEIVQGFAVGRESQASIDHYRGMAESLLQDFMGGSFDDMSEQVISEVTGKLTKHIDDNIAPNLPKKESGWSKFFNGCLQSIGGAIALSVIVWLFANVVGKFSLGNISVTYNDKDKLNKTEQVAVPAAPSDSMIIEEVKQPENATPSPKSRKK